MVKKKRIKKSKCKPRVKESSPPQLKQSKRKPKVKQHRLTKSKRKKRGNEHSTMKPPDGPLDDDEYQIIPSHVGKDESHYTINVLWVRHCNSYANDTELGVTNQLDFLKKKVFMQPLCTKGNKENLNYLTQPYNYHTQLLPLLKHHDFKKLKLYSSILPRAMETSKLIGMGMNEELDNDKELIEQRIIASSADEKDRKKELEKYENMEKEFEDNSKRYKTEVVTPMNWCSEVDNIAESVIKKTIGMKGSQNNTSLIIHHIYKDDINRFLGYPDTPPIIKNEMKVMNEEITKIDKTDFYSKWKDTYLPQLVGTEDTLHLVVSHGTFMKTQILGDRRFKIHNLDSFLVQYTCKYDGTLINEKIWPFNKKNVIKKRIQNVKVDKHNEEEALKFIYKISNPFIDKDEKKSIFIDNTYQPDLGKTVIKSNFGKIIEKQKNTISELFSQLPSKEPKKPTTTTRDSKAEMGKNTRLLLSDKNLEIYDKYIRSNSNDKELP